MVVASAAASDAWGTSRRGRPRHVEIKSEAISEPGGSDKLGCERGAQFYFCLHRRNLAENTAERQPRFWGEIMPKNFGKKLYVI